jgi:hypothetical protein
MSASMNTDPDIELFREDLLALKRDVASLTEHVEGGATSTIQNAAGQIARRVRSRSEKAVSLFIEKQPVAALSIAFSRLHWRSRASAVSQSSSASDLYQVGSRVASGRRRPSAPLVESHAAPI